MKLDATEAAISMPEIVPNFSSLVFFKFCYILGCEFDEMDNEANNWWSVM